MIPINWRTATYASLVGYTAIESYIDYRQWRALDNRKLPSTVEGLIEQETVDKSLEYEKDSLKLYRLKSIFKSFLWVMLIYTNTYKSFWDLTGDIYKSTDDSIVKAVIFDNLFLKISFFSLMPFDLYASFVVEEKYGFNKLTLKKFFSDKLKQLIMNGFFTSLFIAGLLKVIYTAGDYFVIYSSLFLVVFYVFVYTVVPVFVVPWFFKLTPLEDGELKTAILELADQQQFPSSNIYLCDGSSRSSHSNAFFAGLPWAKRIVLFDTLVEVATKEEIVGILAHEFGHWKNNDITKSIVLDTSSILVGLQLFSLVYKTPLFYHDFGFHNSLPLYIGFSLFQHLSRIMDLLSNLVQNLAIRAIEYKADEFAAKLGFGTAICDSLVKLDRSNLSATSTDWLYSIYSRSHPNLNERIGAVRSYEKSKKD